MSGVRIQDSFDATCPIRNILSRTLDKWSILVLYKLSANKVMRFKDLHIAIPDISQKMLTVTLRTLQADGFISRKVFAEVPPRVEYRLTDRAMALMPLLNIITVWAKQNMAGIIEDRKMSV